MALIRLHTLLLSLELWAGGGMGLKCVSIVQVKSDHIIQNFITFLLLLITKDDVGERIHMCLNIFFSFWSERHFINIAGKRCWS